MLKNLSLAFVALMPIACANNADLVTFKIGDKVGTVKSKEVLKELKPLFEGVNPQEMNFLLSAPDTFKMVVQNRLFEKEMLISEARELSNYMEDPAYIQSVTYQSNTLPYEFAFKNGLTKLSNEIDKQSVTIAEVSRIMFTNDTLVDDKTPEDILASLMENPDDMTAFSLAAEKYSHEALGAQTGGYLGQVVQGQHPALDVVVFEGGNKGMHTELLSDEFGTYIVYIHTPARKVKASELKKQNLTISPDQLRSNYLARNIKYLYTLNENGILLGKTQKTIDELADKDVLVKLWGKSVTLGQLKKDFEALMGGHMKEPMTVEQLLTNIAPTGNNQHSLIFQQIAIMNKGFDKNLKKSKEFKEQLATNVESIEMDMVYGIVSQELFQSLDTNVTDAELTEYYADDNNKQVVSYNDDGTPQYASFTDSKDALKQAIISKRAESIRLEFQEKLDAKYDIVWDEEALLSVMDEVQEEYDTFLGKNVDTADMNNAVEIEEIEEVIEE